MTPILRDPAYKPLVYQTAPLYDTATLIHSCQSLHLTQSQENPSVGPIAVGGGLCEVAVMDIPPCVERKHDMAEYILTYRIAELERMLYDAGICPVCGKEIGHDIVEPFGYCCWGTSEWTGEPPTIAKLRFEISQLKACIPCPD